MEAITELSYALDTFYFLVSGALVMWMAAGFAMLESGLVRTKNVLSVLMQCLALTAAETGHLVFSTLHTSSAPKTIDRIIDVFPTGEKSMVRSMLSESLRAVITQTLLKRVGGGRVAVVLHLLSPAQRPIQVTQDLRGFWDRTYTEVKKELKGRYPKHHWPDDPWTATPTSRAKPRRRG